MRIIVQHPVIKPHHVKHTAASLTIGAGLAEIFAPYHIGALLFVLSGCVAIYEPYLIHNAKVTHDGE